jgi:hypothetical protein
MEFTVLIHTLIDGLLHCSSLILLAVSQFLKEDKKHELLLTAYSLSIGRASLHIVALALWWEVYVHKQEKEQLLISPPQQT